MSMRDKWTFTYPVKEILEAATDKMEHALGRQQWWEDKKATTLAAIKADGIEIDQSIAEMAYSAAAINNTWGGRQTNVVIKPELLKDLHECMSKIEEHKAKAKQYDAWKQVFTAQPPLASYGLNQDDWMYFFGK